MWQKPIEIPQFFNSEWYTAMKKLGKTDEDIAWDLNISVPLLARWKKNLRIVAGDNGMKSGRKPLVDRKVVIDLYLKGIEIRDIAKQFHVKAPAIYYHINVWRKDHEHKAIN